MTSPKETERLQAQVLELEKALGQAQEFIASLGHELRNPLAAIQGGLELLASTAPERTVWIRQVLSRQTEQLARIIDDLLDLAMISRGTVAIRSQSLELSEIIAGALACVNDLISERGHVLQVSVPDGLRLKADPARLEQIIVNLLSNAAKYTDEGGYISVAAEEEGKNIRIEVRDDGIGLTPEMVPFVFDMFAQAEQPFHRSRGGLGMGLTLARKLVEMHGGTIAAASEGPGKGSVFTVTLPVGALDSEPVGRLAPPALLKTSRRRRILVVDDNQDLAISLSFLLTECGHAVETAFDGQAALRGARVFQPDLILLDVGLPDVNGYQVATRLRAIQRESDHPLTIIGVSGFGNDRHQRETHGRELFDHYLVKPVSLHLLCSLIETTGRAESAAGQRQGETRGHEAEEGDDSNPLRSCRLLIIDDFQTVADMTRDLLEAEGYKTAVAYDGRQGLDLASEFRPHVVLCDLNLAGGLSGWEVASAIREAQPSPFPLLVALTAFGRDEIRRALKKSAFDFHLSKPLDTLELEKLMTAQLGVEAVSRG